MAKQSELDILVAYSSSIATSASVSGQEVKHPFSLDHKRGDYSLPYAYLLDYCQEQGLTASSDVIGPGACSSYWTHDTSGWHKNTHPAHSTQILDKLSPRSPARTAERNLLFSDSSITPFNDPYLSKTFFDKLITYQQLREFAIPTTNIYSSRPRDIQASISRLRKLVRNHPSSDDFSPSLILKDRSGAGGNYIYKITQDYIQNINQKMRNNPKVKFVLQPFLIFDKGYTYNGEPITTDIRLIIQHNQLFKCYIRIAQDNNFLCNQHQGGQIAYLQDSQIPTSITSLANQIIKKLDRPHALYALDFAISNRGNVYFIEGNNNPGINYTPGSKKGEASARRTIRHIIDEMIRRLNSIK